MKKEADKQRASVYAEGALSIISVLRAQSRRVERIYLSDSVNRENKNTALLMRLAMRYEIPTQVMPDSFFEENATGTTHGGILAEVGERSYISPDELFRHEKGFIVMLCGVEDPYNFGYAMRSLYAAGAGGFILTERNWMSAAGVVIRASAGTSEMCELSISPSPEELVDIAHSHGYRVVCAEEGADSLYEKELPFPLLLIIGGEKRGIDRKLIGLADDKVTIPYAGKFDKSLTAAAAAAVIGFEIMRKNIGKK